MNHGLMIVRRRLFIHLLRFCYLLGALAILAACRVVGLCVWYWAGVNLQHDIFLESPSAVQMFRESAEEHQRDGRNEVLPLVVQAETLASYLNPPELADEDSSKVLSIPEIERETVEPMPAIRPVTPSVRFKLCATSYYPNEPGRSMALVSDVGSAEGDQRWVKEGAKLGHFVVHEIRRGMIVYRDGGELREMAVERGTALPRLVRDPRPASPTARAAPPAEPDSIEVSGD
jgi:hypothetical protein